VLASVNDPVVSCANLRKYYPDVKAVDGIDLEVHRGECFGLLGPNGAGKTTTIEILEGLNTPDGGDVRILGLPIRRPDTAQTFRMLCRHNRYVQAYGKVRDPDEIARRERIWDSTIDAIEFETGRQVGAAPLRSGVCPRRGAALSSSPAEGAAKGAPRER